jgi:hypothetical protein
MNYSIEGKSTGVGAFDDGKIYHRQLDGSIKEVAPLRTEYSGTGNHWTYVFEGILPEDIVVQWGYNQGGILSWSVNFADGRPYEGSDALNLANLAIQASRV